MSLLVLSQHDPWSPVICPEHMVKSSFLRRIQQRLLVDLPSIFKSHDSDLVYASRFIGEDRQICFGIICADYHEMILDRILLLVDYFVGCPPDEDSLKTHSDFLNRCLNYLLNNDIHHLSHGALISAIRKYVDPKILPADKQLKFTIEETVKFIGEDGRIEGRLIVNNPLANDLILRMRPTLELTSSDYIRRDGEVFQLELGRYELGRYQSSNLPFQVSFDNKTDRTCISIIWSSKVISDHVKVSKCRLTFDYQPSGPILLEPPTMSHRAHICDSKLIWDFSNVTAATRYSISFSGQPPRAGHLDFLFEGCSLAGFRLDDLELVQESTNISALPQLAISHICKSDERLNQL